MSTNNQSAQQHNTRNPLQQPPEPDGQDESESSSSPPHPDVNTHPESEVLSSFSYFNIQGLAPKTKPSKVPYVRDQLSKNDLFIGLTETWLSDDYTEAELSIENYTLFRGDSNRRKSRRGRFGGGVSLYLRNDIASTTEELVTFSNGAVELLAVYSESENLLIATIYRQPDDTTNNRPSSNRQLKPAIDTLQEAVMKLDQTPGIIIGGDFNLPHTSWP